MPTPPDYWPEGAQAAAYLARVQALLDARGLGGTAPHLIHDPDDGVYSVLDRISAPLRIDS